MNQSVCHNCFHQIDVHQQSTWGLICKHPLSPPAAEGTQIICGCNDIKNRRDKANPPNSNMVWSDRFEIWLDQDTRSPERRALDETIAQNVEQAISQCSILIPCPIHPELQICKLCGMHECQHLKETIVESTNQQAWIKFMERLDT